MGRTIEVQIPEKLTRIFTTPKPLKIMVGGRGSGKSYSTAQAFSKFIHDGKRVLCCREFQNSVNESVHSLLSHIIDVHQIPGIQVNANNIESARGGKCIYMGLARNAESIKSLDGIERVWVEEAQTISQKSLDLLMPTIRAEGSEVWMTLNRGSSRDAISQTYLTPDVEKEIALRGYYEDDFLLAVQINYNDNPWFTHKLEIQRQRDFDTMERARYNHIWLGHYNDSVENAIISAEWMDACIDAHKKLNIKPEGIETVAFDPADSHDDKALAYRHGIVIKDVRLKSDGDVNEGADWALDFAQEVKADAFIFDVCGLGLGLKRQINQALSPKNIQISEFNGANNPQNPTAVYEPIDGNTYSAKQRNNQETFANLRAQQYWLLRDRMYKTWQAVTQGAYINPDELISFSSEIECMEILRSELCRIPRKETGMGKIAILSKPEMKKLGISSPNAADAVCMSFFVNSIYQRKRKPGGRNYADVYIV